MPSDEVSIQRAYYAATAQQYDKLHIEADDQHNFALAFMSSIISLYNIASVLDVGAGTGRALVALKSSFPDIRLVGLEPSGELREIAYQKGIPHESMVDGDSCSMPFKDGEFDLVCEFACLHHVPDPAKAVSEMLRVSRRAIFISDSNNFGQGSVLLRCLKQTINTFGLWRVANLIKTKGNGYSISDTDGLFYSYSVFDNYRKIRAACKSVHFLNTCDARPNLYRSSPQVALLGLK